jgi:hypothetical protein
MSHTDEQRVGMVALERGPALERARQRLSEALGGATVDAPGEDGTFDVHVQAASFEDALQRVWDAVAAAGVDDQIAFEEHPDLPEHWRRRARGA